MNPARLLSRLYAEPWLITSAGHAAVSALVERHLLGEPLAAREGVGPCGEEVELEQMEIADGIARIPIGGVLGMKLSPMQKGGGAVDVLDVTKELREAADNPEVHSILLEIDSPGGMAAGIPELADRIRAEAKPIYAFTQGEAASAAYWLASASDAILATRSAEVGSVGIYVPFADQSRRFHQAGVEVDVIRSGRFKGMGLPGTSLSQEQRAELQRRVDQLGAQFRAHVVEHRGAEMADLQGQMFAGREAVEKQLADLVVPDLQAALDWIQSRPR
jgi:signal peptide peptidase SppA